MSQIKGGRIVPILTGHDPLHPKSLDQSTIPTSISQISDSDETSSSSSNPPISPPVQDRVSDQTRKQGMGHPSLDMPALKERGLFALPTEGDGNCLYYSLSDQLYANTYHANEIRQRIADHMAANKEYFMQFVSEGGERRRPKRAAASAYATRSADVSVPSDQDKDSRFQEMIATTRRNAEWGSSEHIQAFCQAYKLDVTVYTMNAVHPFQDVNATPGESRNVIHIAYHEFKHYSSVRSIGETHKGLLADMMPAQASLAQTDNERKHVIKTDGVSASVIAADKPDAAHYSSDASLAVDVYAPWDIKSIQEGLGGRYDRETIIDMLQKCRGDIDRAFAALLDEKSDDQADKKNGPVPAIPIKPSLQASRDTSPFSTGSKRSADDSDDSEAPQPARRVRPKRRFLSNLTLGVGISFRDEQDEVVSLNLRMPSENPQGQATDPSSTRSTTPEQSDVEAKKCRRSGRLSRSRPA
ncbi:hypothetical protein N7541_009687 [Penicillium brevicompactum]|uniref:OTU domain-containing protein n=1 Tax=Penicillium brevicompactum TaxID=5074 RepID=A0A9W9UGS3_PENBR|nr:hypothetical protein N7541_009687 [Penicillium brevicompactum]